MSLRPTALEFYSLHRYFSAVSDALSMRMRPGSTPSQDNLTFLLCDLMEDGLGGQHVLGYSPGDLNRDLESCGSTRLRVSFEAHEHSRRFEGKVSCADLGLIFRHESDGQTADPASFTSLLPISAHHKLFTVACKPLAVLPY